MKFGIALTGAAVAGLLTAGAGAAMAQKMYTYGQWLPPKHNVNLHGIGPMLEELTKAGMPWKLVAGGQLFSAKATLKSVGNGTAEAGLVVPSYARTSLKHAFVIADMLMLGENELIMNGAAIETYFKDCPDCLADYGRNKTIFLAGYGVGGYSLLCREPNIKTVADLKGLKLRTTGALGRWARALGGTPVSMTMSDVPEAVKRGQIDCILGPMAWLKSYPISDSIKSVLNYQFGSYSGLGLVVMNRAAWDAYSPDQKRAMWKALPGAIARTVVKGYIGDDIAAKKMAAEAGIQVFPPDAEIRKVWEDHKKNEMATAIGNAKKLRAKNPERIAGDFQKRIDRWTKIIADAGLSGVLAAAGPNPAKLDEATAIYEKLMYDHIYSKIDPTKL
tara:strand:- start:7867 stop:9033 length:1167 start_codon:yes stop_codon:yes gene_type:complete